MAGAHAPTGRCHKIGARKQGSCHQDCRQLALDDGAPAAAEYPGVRFHGFKKGTRTEVEEEQPHRERRSLAQWRPAVVTHW